mmetsp:Transcript_99630/g.281929  ORF Transcript_99630/g.281929 Transcript_99630/m.281929 type:complete len:97 (-) Transcript_99630:459-749(-)
MVKADCMDEVDERDLNSRLPWSELADLGELLEKSERAWDGRLATAREPAEAPETSECASDRARDEPLANCGATASEGRLPTWSVSLLPDLERVGLL